MAKANKRFAAKQKDKLRPIDNFARNRVNEAWTNVEKLDLHAIDNLVWALSLVYKCAFGKGSVDFSLKDGARMTGKLHEEWALSALQCQLITFDLKDAYKQMGIHESDRRRSVVTLRSSRHEGVDHYLMNCLPFGAVSSVHNFNQIARLIWAIGVRLLRIPWCNYFDDYPVFSPQALSFRPLRLARRCFDS